MPTRPSSSHRFTIEQANKMLPLVRAITTDLVQLWKIVAEKRERLSVILARRDLGTSDPYSDELAGVERGLQDEMRRVQDYLRELRQLGVEPGAPEGYVDFPSTLDGQPVYLSWRLGEPEILYWRRIDGDVEERRPLTQNAATGGFERQVEWEP
jgi:hypothetical protein